MQTEYATELINYMFAVATGKFPFFKSFFHDNPIFSALFCPIAAVNDQR